MSDPMSSPALQALIEDFECQLIRVFTNEERAYFVDRAAPRILRELKEVSRLLASVQVGDGSMVGTEYLNKVPQVAFERVAENPSIEPSPARLLASVSPPEEQDQRITEIREHLRNAEIVKRTLDRAGATPFLTTYYVEDVAYLLAALSPTAPKDVLDSLHQVFTRNGISSYTDYPNLAGDVIHWACEMYRQSKMPPQNTDVPVIVEHDGAALIRAERQRQVTAEGWTPEHDDSHENGELLAAAVRYVDAGAPCDLGGRLPDWPWEPAWFKPTDDPVRNLVKAGALIAAEIDRLLRQSGGLASVTLPQEEQETIAQCVDHWFIQGGQAQFGELDRTPHNADELISEILTCVRKSCPTVGPPEEQDLQADVKEAITYVNKIVVESDGYPMMHTANHLRTLLANAFIAGKLSASVVPPERGEQEKL